MALRRVLTFWQLGLITLLRWTVPFYTSIFPPIVLARWSMQMCRVDVGVPDVHVTYLPSNHVFRYSS